jgi:hypothetical protein
MRQGMIASGPEAIADLSRYTAFRWWAAYQCRGYMAQDAFANGFFATRSHATDPLLCAAGEESLRIVVEEDMAGKAARIGALIKGALAEMPQEFEPVGDIRGRDFAAWLGLVPRQYSTGGKAILGRISKRGGTYIRTLLVRHPDAAQEMGPLQFWVLPERGRDPSSQKQACYHACHQARPHCLERFEALHAI